MLSHIHSAKPFRVARQGDALLVARNAAAEVRANGDHHALAPGDAVMLAEPDEREIEIVPASIARLHIVDLWRRG